jgi:cytochrome c-type biogenesis protein CcmH
MIFWLIVTALIIVALVLTLGPYWRKTVVNTPDRTDLNIRLYKHRLAELEADLKNKVLDKDLYDQAVSELKLQLLSDVPENQESRKIAPRRTKLTIVTTALLVPALSIGLYILLGNVGVATGKIDTDTSQGSAQIQDMISALAKRLESQPDDVRGWVMLGRSYAVTGEIVKSVAAYKKAYALTPENPDVLIGLAEVTILSNNPQLQRRSVELLNRVLKVNPNENRALWLAGYAEAQLGNNDEAIKYWQTLLSLLPPNDEDVEILRQHIARITGTTDAGDPDFSAAN